MTRNVRNPHSYYSPGLIEELKDELQKKLQMEPENLQLRSNLAAVLGRLGQFDESIAEFKKCISVNPNPEYWNDLGKIFLNAGKYEEAIGAFQEVIKQNLLWPDVFFHTALAYRGLSETDKACQSLQEAIKLNPKYREAINERAQLLESMEKKDDALTEYKKVIALFFSEFQSKEVKAYHYDLSVLYDNPPLVEESIRQLSWLVQQYPGYADAHYKLGQALEAKGMKEEAILSFRKALEINPQYETARKSFWKKNSF
ncbi:tetratricopeptide repeat protein [bacterium]|nr:tetratricopeptide repeat protein [bacterium]